jgi:uncharacterized membrane protein
VLPTTTILLASAKWSANFLPALTQVFFVLLTAFILNAWVQMLFLKSEDATFVFYYDRRTYQTAAPF